MKEQKSFTLKELSFLTHSELRGDPTHIITNIADLESAHAGDASFLSNPSYVSSRYIQAMKKSKAGVIFIQKHSELVEGKNYLLCEDPSQAFQQLVELFHPKRQFPSSLLGIHPTAVIHPSAHIEQGTTIGPYTVIDENVHIGHETFIGSGVFIGPNTQIGNFCTIYSNVVIREDCLIGNNVIIQSGAIIGSCGFGYLTDKQGIHTKLNQVGNVKIEDHVEIGANTTIDRARFKSTVIGQGTKIDNLVQIGHGVQIGPYNMIVAQTGIAGSTTTGRHVVLAGHVAVAGHLHLDHGVIVAGKSGVTKSLKKGKYSGIPAAPVEEHNRNQAMLRQIGSYVKKIKELEERLKKLELLSTSPKDLLNSH